MKIGIVGCAGRMGRMLVNETAKTKGCEVGGGTDLPGSPFIGKDITLIAGLEESGVVVGDDPKALFEAVDAVIDFTAPAATMKHAKRWPPKPAPSLLSAPQGFPTIRRTS